MHRRKTDLMPTIPSPRETSRSAIGTPMTPRTPGIAMKDFSLFSSLALKNFLLVNREVLNLLFFISLLTPFRVDFFIL